MKHRNIGRFDIVVSMIEDNPAAVRAVMAQCIIVRAEMRWDRDLIRYDAVSEQFERVEPGRIAPEYTWKIEELDQGLYRATAQIVK
jgi:hypothetical protein